MALLDVRCFSLSLIAVVALGCGGTISDSSNGDFSERGGPFASGPDSFGPNGPSGTGSPNDPSSPNAGSEGGSGGGGGNGPGGSSGGGLTCDGPSAGTSSLRRLTALQYDNAIGDIFEGVVSPSIGLPPSDPNLGRTGFTAEADANIVTSLGATQILESAEDIALQVTDGLDQLLDCYPGSADEACATSFIDRYGRRAYRRSLTDEERTVLLDVYRDAGSDFSFPERMGLVAVAMLQMPQFLYLVEIGTPTESDGDTVRLSGLEMASRLSFLFWDSIPDDALLDAAESGQLDDPDGVEQQARRLLDDERSTSALLRFFHEWMQLHELEGDSKDPDVYPEYDAALGEDFQHELDLFIEHIIADPEATPSTLLSSSTTYVNSRMASFFGLQSSPSSGVDDWQPVELAERAGLLTRPAVLAGLAYPGDTSPIHRGNFVLGRLLCEQLPDPPADALARQPETPPDSTQRERSEARRSVDECATCHAVMDPVGLGLEEYDGIGRLRSGVDNTGSLPTSIDVGGDFSGAAQLGDMLAGSEQVRSCFAKQWMRYALSRMDEAADGCSIAALEDDMSQSSYALRELFVKATRTDSFRFRTLESGE